MATSKQATYLRDLMVEAGHAHPQGFLRGSSKTLPHGPSMAERSGSVDDWIERLSVGQASDVIAALKGGA